MSTKENKALIHHSYDLMNRGELTEYFKLLSSNYIEHLPTGNMSLEQTMQGLPTFFIAFPDAHATIDDMVAEGDKVAARITWRGTHQGNFIGIPPTGKKFEMTNTAIFRIVNGKWAETWATVDNLGLLQQLGIIPKQP
jgi:steroid delta-isomerase-like uncharacterized protein